MPPSPGLSVVGPEILTNHVVVGCVVGVGVTDGVGVGVADADAKTEAVAFAVVDAACDALPAPCCC